MLVVDSSAWIEWLIDGPLTAELALKMPRTSIVSAARSCLISSSTRSTSDPTRRSRKGSDRPSRRQSSIVSMVAGSAIASST